MSLRPLSAVNRTLAAAFLPGGAPEVSYVPILSACSGAQEGKDKASLTPAASPEFYLLQRTCHTGERVVGVRADQPQRANHNHQNHCQHYCVFGDVLPLFPPQYTEEVSHTALHMTD